MAKLKAGLIGYGYWGPNIARTIAESKNVELKYCADLVDASLEQVKEKYPKVIATKNYFDILNDDEVSMVFLVTPTKTHFKIAKDVLNAKKNLFIEKPITDKSDEAKQLIAIAKKNKLKLAVGHLFLFNPAVNYIKATIAKGEIGKIRHLHFQRRNLGPIRSDVNVMWDLSPHDISMLLYFVKSPIKSVQATGQSFLQKNIEDVVSATIKFQNGIIANMIFSWIDPIKIRDITIVGDKKMLLFDDVSENKVKIFDKNVDLIKNTRGVTFSQYKIELYSGEETVPKIISKEPLREEFNSFVSSVLKNTPLINDGNNGLQVVKVIEAMQRSLSEGSKVILFK